MLAVRKAAPLFFEQVFTDISLEPELAKLRLHFSLPLFVADSVVLLVIDLLVRALA